MMQKWIQIIVLSFLAFEITTPKSVLTQYLIRTNKNNLQAINENNLFWEQSVGEVQFVVVPALKNLEQTKMDYELLDDDVETGIFYWVESRFDEPFRVNEIHQLSKCTILWHDQHLALIRTPSQEFSKNVPRKYLCNLITFEKLPQNTRTHFSYQTSLDPDQFSSTIQAILDSVNIEQIYLTERHLTGEEPFWNNGGTDSIMTRYSHSPEIFKAENYIVSRLENIGLTVELQPFTASTFYDIQFAPEQNNFGWLVSVGWGGKVLKTTNSGSNWFTVSLPIDDNLYDIDFIDQNTGMIAGWKGACLITDNGGSTWNSGGNIFGHDLYALDIVDTSLVRAGGKGIVAQSIDFGKHWQKVHNIVDGYLNNIIAMKQGTTYPDQYYIICAHYDATSNTPMVRAPGADDNGSGTAAVIQAARVLVNFDFKYSIKFVLFPAEEQGLIGSRVYANAALMNGEQILGVINLDMIGYDGNNDGSMEIHAGEMGASQAIANFVNANIASWGLPLIPELKTFNSITASDHSSFWNAGYPAILIIEDFSDFTPDYHTTNDLLSTLRPGYFLANARLAIGSLALLAEIDSLSTSISTKEPMPEEFVLYNPYPNPFNPVVQIEYDLPSSEKVVVEIYNLLGQSIKELVNQREGIGRHRITWDGTTSRGDFAASGIYFVRLQFSNQTKTKKIVLIR